MTDTLYFRAFNWVKSGFIITAFALVSLAVSFLINQNNDSSSVLLKPALQTSSPVETETTVPASQPVITNTPIVNSFQNNVINPVLQKLHLYSSAASNLLMGTAVQESLVGKLSSNVFQIEPYTVDDVNKNFLPNHPWLRQVLNHFYDPSQSLSWNLSHNIQYEIAMARIIYLRAEKPLPTANNIPALGQFWKQNYNTYLGKGNAREFVMHFVNYVSMHPQDNHIHETLLTQMQPDLGRHTYWQEVNLQGV